MEEEAGILEPYQLEFCDLMLLSSDKNSSTLSADKMERLESISRTVMENLGPTGTGLLAITGVPNASSLRRTLLPLARKLALLNHEDRKRLLKDKQTIGEGGPEVLTLENILFSLSLNEEEGLGTQTAELMELLRIKDNGLGSDVSLKNSDRTVSSFAMQLKCGKDVKIAFCKELYLEVASRSSESGSNVESHGECQVSEFKNLGDLFKELGFCMMELGLCLARICDRSIGGQELEQSLLESCTAKGRLVHYHSTLDNLNLKEATCKRKASAEGRSKGKDLTIRNVQKDSTEQKTKSNGNQSSLWQQWHYDYGIFTVLTSPMFIDCSFPSCDQECPSPSGHTYLQIFDPNKNRILKVKASSESFIIQVGESADVLSKGKLCSTLHSVCRPENLENISRETFVVFLQPVWNKTFSLLNYPVERLISNNQPEGNPCAVQELETLTHEFSNIVPPLSTRLKDGMTFAEFSQKTTKQYYGGRGLQSKR